jgi:hypothetical protein
MLHKLLTESTKIKAVFARSAYPQLGMLPPVASVTGTLRPGPAEMLTVSPDMSFDSILTFDPRAATSVRYGDDRVLPSQDAPGSPRLLSGLIFSYEGYLVVLFEIPGD